MEREPERGREPMEPRPSSGALIHANRASGKPIEDNDHGSRGSAAAAARGGFGRPPAPRRRREPLVATRKASFSLYGEAGEGGGVVSSWFLLLLVIVLTFSLSVSVIIIIFMIMIIISFHYHYHY